MLYKVFVPFILTKIIVFKDYNLFKRLLNFLSGRLNEFTIISF